MQKIKLDTIKGAEYNPRFLSDEAFHNLKDSIRNLGLIKPIIVRKENNTILAGHQRTKAMKSLGIEESDCFFLNNIGMQDEVRFNQFHNMSEIAIHQVQPKVRIIGSIETNKYILIKPCQIEVLNPGIVPQLVMQISNMIMQYGTFANAILDHDNNVIISSIYAYCCKLLNKDLYVYKLESDKVEYALNMFAIDYGIFSYEFTPKEPYAQSYAQMSRLRNNNSDKKNNVSTLYETCILPNITKLMKGLDFGCGHGDYVKQLTKIGYNIKGIEFYQRMPGTNDLYINKIKNDFGVIYKDYMKNGGFDYIVCDSVLNSVHCKEAEIAVLQTINALCKKNGIIYYSGRPLDNIVRRMNSKKIADNAIYLKFLDKDGFTGTFRNGRWFYQKFHTDTQLKELTENNVSSSYMIYHNSSSSFQVKCNKDKLLASFEIDNSLKFEFNLPLPNGKSYTFYEDYPDFINKIIENNL